MFFCFLLAACSGSDGDVRDIPAPDSNNPEIRLKADVWQMMEGTRATTYDNAVALQAQGSFTCYMYDANTTTTNAEITTNPDQVNWNSSTSNWDFANGPHRWPASGSLDFFCYMPADPDTDATMETAASYISGISYDATDAPSVTHTVRFTCTNLPMTNTGQGSSLKEFVYAMALDQDNDGTNTSAQPTAGQVALSFKHPFARIKLQLTASHHDITINSITFRGIKNNGSCSFDGTTSTWTPSGVATDFVLTLTGDARVFYNNPDTPTPIGENYIMIPQGWAGEIVVDAVCLFWGDWVNYPNLTTTIPTTWQPGHSYTYTFNISPDDLIVNVSKFTEQW